MTAQFGAQGGAAQVVIDTAVASELNGVLDAVQDLPDNMRREVLVRHGVDSLDAPTRSFDGQRARLGLAEQKRSAVLARDAKRLTILLVLSLLNVFALAMGAVCLFDAYRGKAKAYRGER